MTRSFFPLLALLLLLGCARHPDSVPLPIPSPTPDPTRPLSAAEVRANAEAWQGRVVTVQGVVTSVEPAWATLQSEGAGLGLAHSGDEPLRLAQAVLVTGRVATVEGNLALVALQEVAVEAEQAPLPEPAPLTMEAAQESLLVQAGSGWIREAGWLDLDDGRRVAVQAPSPDVAARLARGTRVDGVRGVLRRSGRGWLLVPPHARDVAVAPPLVALCEIQGAAKQSSLRGERVETVGVIVAAWLDRPAEGLFVQDAACDDDPRTSDAIFVAGVDGAVAAGDRLRLRGTVREHYGRTQVEAESWTVEARGEPLPAPVPLDPPADPDEATPYFEALEGMLVSLDEARVVGPTSRFGEFAVAPARVLRDGERLLRGGPTGAVVLVDDGGAVGPYDVAVGDGVRGLRGPLDFTFGAWKLQLLNEPTIDALPPPPLPTPPALLDGAWSVASWNVENLFDSEDDPHTADDDSTLAPDALTRKLDKLAATLAGPLGSPTIVALQEVETLALLEQLAAHPALGGRYMATLLDGPDARGIDVALLVERARVEVLETAAANACSPVLVPGGAEDETCPDGERLLFARPPLVARLRLDGTHDLYLINVHFKSKSGGEIETQPRRAAQARYVAALTRTLREAAPAAEVLVVGDLNDDERSATLAALLDGTPLINLWETLPEGERYAYNFLGVSQVLDHLLITPGLRDALDTFRPLHLNADFPHARHADGSVPFRASDHDPLLAVFRRP